MELVVEDQGSKRIAHLEAEVVGIKTNISSLLDKIGSQDRVLQTISDKVSSSGQTNWGTIISFVGLLVLIGGAILVPLNANITRNEHVIEKISDSFLDHRRSDAEAGTGLRVSALEREQDLKDEILLGRISNLEKSLERLPHVFETYEEKYKLKYKEEDEHR